MTKVEGESKGLVRFMKKRHILSLLEYEKLTGYCFNRMPCDEFMATLMHDRRYPVGFNMVHNGVEMRVSIFNGRDSALVDMPFRNYFELPCYDVEAKKVIQIPPPKDYPQDPPRKGLDVVYSLRKSDITAIRSRNEKAVTVDRCHKAGEDRTVMQPITLDAILEGWTVPVDISYAAFSGIDEATCSAVSADRTWVVNVTMPLADFFGLPNRIRVWPGYAHMPEEEAPNAA